MKKFFIKFECESSIEAESENDAIDDFFDGLKELPEYLNIDRICILDVKKEENKK